MTTCSTIWPRPNAIGKTAFLSCLCVSLFLIPTLRAEDGFNRASNMLDGLKRRSAAERWQRVKRQYPVDPPAPRINVPSRLPQDRQRLLPDDDLPPSPEGGFSIPRLTAMPSDTSTDWILPVRQPVLDDGEDATAELSNAARFDDTKSTETPSTTAEIPKDNIATRNVTAKTESVEKRNASGSRSPLERMIGNIAPYYDRDRDRDIREFAIEKGKEFDIPFKAKSFTERSFPQITLAWEPTNFYHYPLYFADPALERYGHTYPPLIQPLASIGRMGAQFVLLPYQMVINPPGKEDYPLGWYRPGECAPKLHYQLPLNAQAAAVEAAVVAGLFFVIP